MLSLTKIWHIAIVGLLFFSVSSSSSASFLVCFGGLLFGSCVYFWRFFFLIHYKNTLLLDYLLNLLYFTIDIIIFERNQVPVAPNNTQYNVYQYRLRLITRQTDIDLTPKNHFLPKPSLCNINLLLDKAQMAFLPSNQPYFRKLRISVLCYIIIYVYIRFEVHDVLYDYE